jgi:uncharacterized protein involved in response to NO
MQRLPALLFAAPHRLAFLTGVINLSALMLWWGGQLVVQHVLFLDIPRTETPAALLHGPVTFALLFTPFIFGFLMTVFPRWMGYPDLTARQFGPVAAGLAMGSLLALSGLWVGHEAMLIAGLCVIALAHLAGIIELGRVLAASVRDAKPHCWHAWSALAALVFGCASLVLATASLAKGEGSALPLFNRMSLWLFLVPVFITVAHRMVPFFAGSVVEAYVRWRPDWLIALLWALFLVRVIAEGLGVPMLAAGAAAGLALTTGTMAFKWWPRAKAPGLFNVLIWGFAWAPLGCLLDALALAGFIPARASVHAMTLGFACSLLIAMVTRVTHGHSGRPLEMSTAAWLAFGAVQLATLARLGAAFQMEAGHWLVAAVGLFVLGTLPWTLRHAAIYLRPRIDGKPG